MRTAARAPFPTSPSVAPRAPPSIDVEEDAAPIGRDRVGISVPGPDPEPRCQSLSHRHVAGTPWPPKLAQMWLDPSFIRCRRGARNGTSGPWNGQRACAAKRRGRLQVDEVHSPRLPRRYRQGASPKWLLLRCQAGASLTSHASTGGGEGALAMTSSVVKVSEDGQSTWACQALEA